MKFDAYVYINLTLTVACFIFLILLLFAYFSKKNMKNIENIIYKHMLITNLVSLIAYIFEFSLCICVLNNPSLEAITLIFAKIASCTIGLWSLLIVFYVIFVAFEDNKFIYNFIRNNYNKLLVIIYIIVFIAGVFTFFQNITFNYLHGVELVPFIYVSAILYPTLILLFLIVLIKGRKLPKKKSLPMYLIILISLIALSFSIIGLDIIVMFLMMTIINQMMFHTIENPDMKMVTELTLAKETAEKASQAKSDFLSSMSHELKTPLNAILGFSNIIKNSDNIDSVHNDIDEIIVSSQKLLELVDSILDVNQLDNNNLEVINDNYNLRNLVNSIIDKMQLRIRDKEIELKYNVSNDIPTTLYGDSGKIKTILNNLLSNAIKYTDRGVIQLDINCFNNNDICNLTFNVSDTGRGISEEQRITLFDKFSRLEEDKDSDIEGTGLGLNLTKSLVDLLEGDISVSSIVNQGSTFTVKITQKIVKDELL